VVQIANGYSTKTKRDVGQNPQLNDSKLKAELRQVVLDVLAL